MSKKSESIFLNLLNVLVHLPVGKVYTVEELSINTTNDLLESLLKKPIDISQNWNGHDLDWSIIEESFIHDGYFEIWGCAFNGNVCFQKIR